MALISCPECNGKVSDRAKSCPHCGYPLSMRRVSKFDIGQICTLTYSPSTKVEIIGQGHSQYLCRDIVTLKKDWFYDSELTKLK